MNFRPSGRPGRSLLVGLALVLGAATLVLLPAAAQPAQAATSLPCDIYAASGTPCVAAHSTVRALYGGYGGRLYQVRRGSDGATTDVGTLAAGGIANAGTQESFCSGTGCVITAIYDQSPQHNDLTVAGGGGAAPNPDRPADAFALPVSAGGRTAYGVSISPGMGYRKQVATGVATHGRPEGMYMVTTSTNTNSGCCFDYGNAETSSNDTGNGHMDAVNFGTTCYFGPCGGSGPWVAADLENGLFQGGGPNVSNTGNTGNHSTFVTALLKNNGQTTFALKGGDATRSGLTTWYDGPLPNGGFQGYTPMQQEGSIILGIGGDNSNGSSGNFLEGVMTAGYPSNAADNAVQANIASVGYGGSDGVAGGSLNPGSAVSLQATTACCTDRYLRHAQGNAITSHIDANSSALDKNDATWIVRRGLVDNVNCVSFESRNFPGEWLRHSHFVVYRQPDDGSALFHSDATFCPRGGQNGRGTSFASSNYPDHSLRHYNATVYIASNGGPNPWDAQASWADDVSWLVSPPWAP